MPTMKGHKMNLEKLCKDAMDKLNLGNKVILVSGSASTRVRDCTKILEYLVKEREKAGINLRTPIKNLSAVRQIEWTDGKRVMAVTNKTMKVLRGRKPDGIVIEVK